MNRALRTCGIASVVIPLLGQPGMAGDTNTNGSTAPSIEKVYGCAEAGDPDCEMLLGVAYQLGAGLEQNADKALHWIQRAADGGHHKAQLQLGMMYLFGNGVQTNYDEAAKWIGRAADDGIAEAQFVRGALLEGEGDPLGC